MALLRYIVPDEWDGGTLDAFLRKEHNLSGTTIKMARRREGGLTMDGVHIRTVDPVCAGACVVVDTGEERRKYRPSEVWVAAVFENDDLIVFDKPAGMPCHPSQGHPYDTLANVYAARASTKGMVFRPMGRLDRDTSGLVPCAKHPHAAWDLPPRTQKQYLAVLCGCPDEERFVVDAPIGHEEDSPRRAVIPGGKPSLTRCRILLVAERYSLALLTLETGRTHQIRVHMAHVGHPLAGDALYGGDCTNITRQALHCAAMQISDYPAKGRTLRLRAPLPDDLRRLLPSGAANDAISRALCEKG